ILSGIEISYKLDTLNESVISSSREQGMRIIAQMSKTIDDFKNFFRADKNYVTCTISDVVDQALSIIEPTIKSKGIIINLYSLENSKIYCLKNELSQVIVNILANSMDAIVENRIENGEISISMENKNNNSIILIGDNAGGINSDIIEKIFEPYFTTKEENSGTGIGLYMSKIIIEKHMKGKLEVENSLLGASFKISIPN
ncbi:MAG: HAMP domain-containing sensor histidine kinase, partial [Campylobacterota bacterium]|nr:HAMP domain-containing sensor histidine kinase [Campylobacterota bacterium]